MVVEGEEVVEVALREVVEIVGVVASVWMVVVFVSGVVSLMLESGFGILRVVVEEEARPVWSVRVMVVVVVMVDGVVTVVVVSTMCSGGLVLVVDVVVVIDVVMPSAEVVVMVLVVGWLGWSAWVVVVESAVVVDTGGGWISFARRCHSVLSRAMSCRW